MSTSISSPTKMLQLSRLAFLFLFFVLFTVSAYAQDLPAASVLLDKSIAYHDPAGAWYSSNHTIDLLSRRPSGADRQTTIMLSHAKSMFGIDMIRDEKSITAMLSSDGDCEAQIDGSSDISEEDSEKYRLSCERQAWMRDYHGYMLGLPMNLKDPGTILDPVAKRITFEGKDVIALKVTYTEEVGGDVWYFYINPENHALIGCRFYHDESKNDGEYLIFEGETAFKDARLPKIRKWYYNSNDEFLGEDEIRSFTSSDG